MLSKAYHRALEESKRHQAGAKTYNGKFLRPHKPWLVDLVQRLGVTSALDYGCGKGEQYTWTDPADGQTLEQALGFEVTKYDPAWPPFAAAPTGQFDLVICTHVLNTIPVVDLPEILSRIYGHAGKAVFIAEKIGAPRKQVFSKPEEHGLLFSIDDWMVQLAPHAANAFDAGIETNLSFRTWLDGPKGGQTPLVQRFVRWHCGWATQEANPI